MIGSSDPWFTGSKKPLRSRLKEGLTEHVVQVDAQDTVKPRPWTKIAGYVVLLVGLAVVAVVVLASLISSQQAVH